MSGNFSNNRPAGVRFSKEQGSGENSASYGGDNEDSDDDNDEVTTLNQMCESTDQAQRFEVEVESSNLANHCGIEGKMILLVGNIDIRFEDPKSNRIKYSFQLKWIRQFGKYKQSFNFEVGRNCPSGEGTVVCKTPSANLIHKLVTEKSSSESKVVGPHPHTEEETSSRETKPTRPSVSSMDDKQAESLPPVKGREIADVADSMQPGFKKRTPDPEEALQFPLHRAWRRLKLEIRYKNELLRVEDVTSEIPPIKLQFAMETENVKKSVLVRLKKKMTLEKSKYQESVIVEMCTKLSTKEITDSISGALRDKVIRELSFETEQMFRLFLETLDDHQDLLRDGIIGIFVDSTDHDVRVYLIGLEGDVAAIEDMSKPSEATEENIGQCSVPPSRNLGIHFDQQRDIFVGCHQCDIGTIQYLHGMQFKEHLSKHCRNVRCAYLASKNNILEITGPTKSEVVTANNILSTFLGKQVRKEIPVSAMVLKFLQTEVVLLHLQKKLQSVGAYVQVSDEVVVWTDDAGKLEEAERRALGCFVDQKVTGRLELPYDIGLALEKSKQKIQVYEGEGDDELHVVYLKDECQLATTVVKLLEKEKETKWTEIEYPLNDYVIKYAMATKLDCEIRKPFPDVEIKFCPESLFVKIGAEQESEVEDAYKELVASVKDVKKIGIQGLSEGIEQLLLRTHISSYVASELKQKYLLFMKDKDGFVCIGKGFGKGKKLKEDIQKKCFMTTDVRKDFLELEYGKQFLDKYGDQIYIEWPEEKSKNKSKRLCFTRDLELKVDDFVKKCTLNQDFSRKCNSATSHFLQTYGSTIVQATEKKHNVTISFKNETIVFKGEYKSGEKALQELERKICTDYLYFKNGERPRNLLESEEGKKYLDSVTRSRSCCWSMTCQSDGKNGELEKIMKNGVNHLTSWVPLDGRSTVSVVEADFSRTDFDVLVIPTDNKMWGENILQKDGSFEDYGRLVNSDMKQLLQLGSTNWFGSCERFGSKALVLVPWHRMFTLEKEQSVERITEDMLKMAMKDVCQNAFMKSKQSIGVALPCGNAGEFLKGVIFGFLNGIDSYCKDNELKERAHLYICVQGNAKSIIEGADVFLSQTYGIKQTRRIVSATTEGVFSRPATSVHVKQQSIFEVKAQCLVVVIDKNLDLSQGYLSDKVKTKAGSDELVREIKEKYPYKKLKPGEMITTSPGKLKKVGVKMLIFGYLKRWGNFAQQLQVLQQFVTDCLITADENDCKSVAFPALGTGNLAYPPRDVAKVMHDGIEKYIAESMSGSLDTVFVCALDKHMYQVLSMEERRRSVPKSTREGDVENSSDGDDILTATDTRIHYTVVIKNHLHCKPSGEYVQVYFLPVKKDKSDKLATFEDTWQLNIECGQSVKDLKDAVQRMVQKCEDNFITSVYVHCSRAFGFSFGEQAETIVETIFDLPKDKYPSCRYKYLSNVVIVTQDETGFFNIEERLAKGQGKKAWYTALFGDVNARVWRKETQLRPQCSVRVKLIGTEKENVGAVKEAIEKYLFSEAHDQKTYMPEKQCDEVCAEVNPGILKYLKSREDYYITWKNEVELVFHIQVVEQRDNDGLKMKIKGSFDSIKDVEDYLEKYFPDLPKRSQAKGIEFDYFHFTTDKEQVVLKIPISKDEKSRVMEIFAEEIQALTRSGFISELSSVDDGINVTCKKDKEAHVKAKFYYFKMKVSQMEVKTMQFDSESGMDLAKSVCMGQCPDHTTFVYKDTEKKKIEIMGLNPKAVDALEMTINREVAESYEDDKTGVKKAFSFGLLHVYVYQCDILNADVDCIVSASNKGLVNSWGVSKYIATAAGNQYLKECEEMRKIGELKLTECRTTGSGRLEFKKIVHVNCMLKTDNPVELEQLKDIQNSVANCLVETDKLGMKSVALPFICSGSSGFDIVKCAQQYIRALNSTCSKSKCLREVHFVDKHSVTVQDVCKVFEAYFERQSEPAPADSTVKALKFKDGGKLNICYGKIQLSRAQGISVMIDKNFNEKENETLKEIQNVDNSGNFELALKNCKKGAVSDVTILPISGRMMFDVLLAVLPVWSESIKFERDTRITVKNILRKADEKGLSNLALSLPGKEKDALVRKLCYKAFSDEILDFFQLKKTILKDVSVYVAEDSNRKEMSTILETTIAERRARYV